MVGDDAPRLVLIVLAVLAVAGVVAIVVDPSPAARDLGIVAVMAAAVGELLLALRTTAMRSQERAVGPP